MIQNPNGRKQCVLGSNYFADDNNSSTFLDLFYTDEDSIADASIGCSGDGSDVFLQSANAITLVCVPALRFRKPV